MTQERFGRFVGNVLGTFFLGWMFVLLELSPWEFWKTVGVLFLARGCVSAALGEEGAP